MYKLITFFLLITFSGYVDAHNASFEIPATNPQQLIESFETFNFSIDKVTSNAAELELV